MNVVCSVDIEGATAIVSPKEVSERGIDYEKGREYLTRDVNAAVEGAVLARAERIVLHDSHGLDCRNILFDKVHPSAEVVRGTPILFFEDLRAEFDACFLIAAHSSSDEPRGVLNHFFSSAHFKSVRVEGRPVSEGDISAALAGHFGIPTVLVTGDDVCCSKMRRIIPEIETVVVKHAISRYAAICLPFSKTEPLIRDAAKRALERTQKGEIPPYRYDDKPRQVEIDMGTPYQAQVIAELTQGETFGAAGIRWQKKGIIEIFRTLRLALYLVNSPLII